MWNSTRRLREPRAPCRSCSAASPMVCCWCRPATGGCSSTQPPPTQPAVAVEPLQATDFSRPLARAVLTSAPASVLDAPADWVTDLTATVLSAEAAGITRWTLDTAVAYAKVREQFGKPIGSFQAIKHLCAEMLCRTEQVAVAAADAARAANDGDHRQLSIAAAIAAGIGIDAAKANAKDCIQVLGGIGITWEHDAHLYLRRAYGIGQFLGGPARWLRRTAELTQAGVRRDLSIDLSDVADLRPEIADAVAGVAALPDDKRQAKLAEAGLLAPHWPAPYGRGAGPAEQLLIDQELSSAGVTRPDLVIGWWAAPTILEHGTPEQVERFVPGTLSGDIFWCQLFSEPEAGSDLASLRTKAVRVDGGWELTGQKVWTSSAHKAQWGVCLARTDPDAPKHKGITYFLIDMSSPGILIRPLREITGDALFNEVFLDGVFVPDEMVVGTVNDGWRLARTTLANERIAMAGRYRARQSDGRATGRGGQGESRCRATGSVGAVDHHRAGRLAARPAHRSARGGRPRPRCAIQRAQTHRRAIPAGAGRIPDGSQRGIRHRLRQASQGFPQHPLPDDRRRHRADPADAGRRTASRAAALSAGRRGTDEGSCKSRLRGSRHRGAVDCAT